MSQLPLEADCESEKGSFWGVELEVVQEPNNWSLEGVLSCDEKSES